MLLLCRKKQALRICRRQMMNKLLLPRPTPDPRWAETIPALAVQEKNTKNAAANKVASRQSPVASL